MPQDNQRRIQNPVKHLRWNFFDYISTVLGVSQGYEYVSDKTKQNPSALSFISQKIRTAVSTNFMRH